MILDALLDAFWDTAKTVPFLLLAFFLLEAVEHYSDNFMNRTLGKVGKAGPLMGAVFGCIPQCGFSVAAANLYAGGVITLGTLMAVFLSTSDEAILLLLGHPDSGPVILKLILGKVLIGVAAGYLTDLLFAGRKEHKHIEDLCRGCGCSEDHGIIRPALRHTIKLAIYVFVFTAILNLILGLVGMDALKAFLRKDTWLQPFLTALLGLIPNCASSILITELYLAGGLSLASAMAGLCAGAGVGMAVLFRENHPVKENIAITGILYLFSAGAGLLLQFAFM